MTPLRQRMLDALVLRGMAQRTQQSYIQAVAGLARHYRRDPEQLNADEVQRYLLNRWSSAVAARAAARRSTPTSRMKVTDPKLRKWPVRGFTAISIPRYVELHAASNAGTNVKELAGHPRQLLKAKLAGALCQCGEPIWVVGSAQVGMSCFTCITGEALPDNDYEVVTDHDVQHASQRARLRRR